MPRVESTIKTREEQQARSGDQIVLGMLDVVDRNSSITQRHVAGELGIALGLVNSYLKRCVRKGLIKIREAPARRYTYYLTPQGFAEKSRLTVSYLTSSLSLFRRAKADCSALFVAARERGYKRVVLMGCSDLAEIAILCAIDCGIEIVAVVDSNSESAKFVGVPVARSFETVTQPFDAVVITELANAHESWERAKSLFERDRLLVPLLLGLATSEEHVPS
jgi:predicted transcriptional regulator